STRTPRDRPEVEPPAGKAAPYAAGCSHRDTEQPHAESKGATLDRKHARARKAAGEKPVSSRYAPHRQLHRTLHMSAIDGTSATSPVDLPKSAFGSKPDHCLLTLSSSQFDPHATCLA